MLTPLLNANFKSVPKYAAAGDQDYGVTGTAVFEPAEILGSAHAARDHRRAGYRRRRARSERPGGGRAPQKRPKQGLKVAFTLRSEATC